MKKATNRSSNLPGRLFENLEPRVLLSGWATVDDLPDQAAYLDIASDANGNVYAVGMAGYGTNPRAIVREKPTGSSTWTTILQQSGVGEFNRVVIGSAGELYLAADLQSGGNWNVYSYTPGQSSAQLLEHMSGSVESLALDGSGNLFAGGSTAVTTTTTSHGKTTTTTVYHWNIREKLAGQSNFTSVDDVATNADAGSLPDVNSITCVPSGASAGIYAVGAWGTGGGYTSEHWIVRKSADGGHSWTTVDDFAYTTSTGSAYGSRALGIAADTGGNVYVAGQGYVRTNTGTSKRPVYTNTDNLVVRKSANGGNTWTNDLVTATGIEDESVGMGADAAGNIYLATAESSAGTADQAVIRTNANGAWNVIDDYQLASNQDSFGYGFSTDPAGNLYEAGYGIDASGVQHGFVRAAAPPPPPTIGNASAIPAGPEFRVNTITAGDQGGGGIAMDANGNFVCAYSGTDTSSPTQAIFLQRYTAAGVPIGGEFKVNTTTSGANARIAMDPAGDFVVVWNGSGSGDSNGVFAQRFNSAGAKVGPEFQVNTYTANLQWFQSVDMDSNGNFTIAWQSQEASGSSLYDVHAQRFAADGTRLGAEFVVNTTTLNQQEFPSVAMDPAGNTLIVWTINGPGDADGIFAQRYDAAGVRQGSEFRVNTYTTSTQSLPQVATDPSGNFVVTWESVNEDGSSFGVYAQRYNAAGVPLGAEFRANTYTTNFQGIPSVACDGAGNFVIAWFSQDQDGSGQGIFAQRFDASGTPIDSEFQVNTYIPSDQRTPSIAAAPSGNFVIIWNSQGEDGSGYGLYAQRFNVPASPASQPAATAATAVASFSTTLIVPSTQSSTSSDSTRLTDGLFDDTQKNRHAHSHRWAPVLR